MEGSSNQNDGLNSAYSNKAGEGEIVYLDYRERGILSPVTDQGHTSISLAMAVISCVESIMRQYHRVNVKLSVQELVNCCTYDGTEGICSGNDSSSDCDGDGDGGEREGEGGEDEDGEDGNGCGFPWHCLLYISKNGVCLEEDCPFTGVVPKVFAAPCIPEGDRLFPLEYKPPPYRFEENSFR
ncbi:Peptidase C1A, papain C-terminal, partial [Trema orientale]